MLEIPFLVLYYLGPVLIPIVFIVWLMRRRTRNQLHKQSRDLDVVQGKIVGLEKDLRTLKAQVGWLTGRVEGIHAEPGKPAEVEPEPVKPAVAEPEPIQTAVVEPEPVKPTPKMLEVPFEEKKPPSKPERVVVQPQPAARPDAYEVLVTKFLENWTGILGTVVLVAGIGFVGTYAALRMPPFFRFLLVLAAAAALFVGYYSLRDREKWETMSLWLRSAAAAVFLFACAASGGLPNAGLMWIEAAGPALAMLMVGIAVNLALSWMVGNQGFASLHVILTLIPIAILPQSPLALGIATVVSGFGVLLTYRERWPAHLIVTLAVYVLFHVYWVLEQGVVLPLPANLLPLAAGSAVVVFLGGALAQHAPIFASQRPELDAVLSHLFSWTLLIGAVVIHLNGVDAFDGHFMGSGLVVLAVIAWTMSAGARRRALDWLRTADALIAQGLLVVALFTWRREFDEQMLFYGLVFVETLLFLRLVVRDRASEAAQIGSYVAILAAIVFIGAGAAKLIAIEAAPMAWQLAGLMIAALAVTVFAGAYFDSRFREQFERAVGPDSMLVVGFLAGAMMVVALIALFDEMAVGVSGFVAGTAFIVGSRRLKSLGLAWSAWMILFVTHGIAWLLCFDTYAGEPARQLAQLAPAVGLTLFGIWMQPAHSSATAYRMASVYLLGIDLGLAAYLLLAPTSALLPIVTWLIMSLIALEAARKLQHIAEAAPTLHVGYLYVIAAAVGYVTVVLPTVSYAGPVNLRLAIAVFGMATLLYWWFGRPGEPLASFAHWRKVRPYFLEGTLALLTTTVFVEVALVWRPIAWMLIALLFLMPTFKALAERFAFYSLAAFYTTILAVTVNVSTTAVPSPVWIEQPWNAGLIAVVIQVAYLFAAYRHLALDQVTFPPGLAPLAQVSYALGKDLPAAICYPFFGGLALFLAWRFEQALLTFLWAAEAFVVFVLSIVFRENHFRLIALGGMAACLGRLIIYDMRETDLFIRGLVFIGVGLLMLGMNAVYNKYGSEVEMQ